MKKTNCYCQLATILFARWKLCSRPGFRYALDLAGLSPNYEIATMNETLASMVSKEIGSIVYQSYYSQYEMEKGQTEIPGSEFDFY